MTNVQPHQRFPGNQSEAGGFYLPSGTSPLLQTKRGRHFHGNGITVNKKAQTAESSHSGVSLPIDGAYPLDKDGNLLLDAKEMSAADTVADEVLHMIVAGTDPRRPALPHASA